MRFKIVTPALGHQVNGNTGGVRCNQGARFTVLLYLFKNFLFDWQVFNHDFNDPVTGSDLCHIIIEIPGMNAISIRFAVYGRRIRFQRVLQCCIYDPVLHCRMA
ncbi:hypothetical protein D9M68_930520 [compost metagenome]